MWYIQRTDGGKPVYIHSWSFSRISRWKPILLFVAAISFPPLADNRNWHAAINSFELQLETFQFPLSVDWLGAINYLQRIPHCNG
jgi:hypothetical protein